MTFDQLFQKLDNQRVDVIYLSVNQTSLLITAITDNMKRASQPFFSFFLVSVTACTFPQ